MKRQTTIWDKFRVCIKWLRDKEDTYKYGLTAVCDFCESTQIEKIDSQTEGIDESKICYFAIYRCSKCEARAVVRELWMKEE